MDIVEKLFAAAPVRDITAAARRPLTDAERQRRHREAMRDLSEIPPPKHRRLRAACRLNLLKFGVTYCMTKPGAESFLKKAPSPRMARFIAALQDSILNGTSKHVRWPRGKGKSTWVKIAMLWAALYGHRRTMLLFTYTKAMGEQAAAEIWRRVEEDYRLAADFPEYALPVRDVVDGSTRKQTYHGLKTHITDASYKFAYRRFAILEGYPNTGAIIAWRGADVAILGLNIDSQRPDFVFIDDPQTMETARNPTTCDKIEDNINFAIKGLGETDARLPIVMASTPYFSDDISERFADSNRHHEFETYTETFVTTWGPVAERDKYLKVYERAQDTGDFAAANEYYLAHQSEIENGAAMLDDTDFDHAHEVSAYQHALHLMKDMGERYFNANYQMQTAGQLGVYKLELDDVISRVNGVPMGVVPAVCNRGLVSFCDVNQREGLRWGVAAVGANRTLAIVAYGRYPETGTLFGNLPDTQKAGRLREAMEDLYSTLRDTPFPSEDPAQPDRYIGKFVFDGGWQTETVAQFVYDSNGKSFTGKVSDSQGMNNKYRPASRSFNMGEKCDMRSSIQVQINTGNPDRPKDQSYFIAFNADYWKELMQLSFFRKPLTPGSMSFFGTDPNCHKPFAREIVADRLKEKREHHTFGFWVEYVWDLAREKFNHYGDVAYGLWMTAAFCGLLDAPGDVVVSETETTTQTAATPTWNGPARSKRKVRYVFSG